MRAGSAACGAALRVGVVSELCALELPETVALQRLSRSILGRVNRIGMLESCLLFFELWRVSDVPVRPDPGFA